MTVGTDVRYAGGYELRYSVRGQPFYVWKKPVPRIGDQFLDCVVYLYPSADHADAGERMGGTGFLVWVPSEMHEHWGYTFCVTNSHIIREAASPVIRLNTKDGSKDVMPLRESDWIHHQDGDDLAVCPVSMNDPDYYNYSALPTTLLVTKEFIERQNIGPGNDVFMVGRFVSHEGRQRNTPVVRFGNISMMPYEPIRNQRGLLQESFLVETRSLSGFSGSPVFLYITSLSLYPAAHPHTEEGNWLLGVDWGHMRTFEPVMEKNREDPISEDWVVPSNSGQMGVVPAWKLEELLNQEELVMLRRRGDEKRTKQLQDSPAVFDAQPLRRTDEKPSQVAEDHEPFTKDDFEDALDCASRRESPPDQES